MTDDPTTTSDHVVITRSIDAPAALVWTMWTDPAHFATWYGPNGATIPVAEFDVRVGGIRRVCMEMRTPDGAMWMWFQGEHTTVDPHQLLVAGCRRLADGPRQARSRDPEPAHLTARGGRGQIRSCSRPACTAPLRSGTSSFR